MQYILVSRYTKSTDRLILGVVTALERGGREATEEEKQKIIALMRESGTESCADALSNGEYNEPRVFDTRAEARKQAAELNYKSEARFNPFTFSVVGIGGDTPKRNLRKIKGWLVYLKTSKAVSASCLDTKDGATIEHGDHFLFATRAEARAIANRLPHCRLVRPVYDEPVSVYADA